MITEEKDGLMIHSQKLAEEGSYAKELAAAAAVELRNLAEEVTKLSYQNAKLTSDLAVVKDNNYKCHYCQRSTAFDVNLRLRKPEEGVLMEELEQEHNPRYQRQASLVSALSERDKIESELRKRLDEAKRHEEDLENELANMWVLVAKMRKSGTYSEDTSIEGVAAPNIRQTRVINEFSLTNGHLSKMPNVDEVCEYVDETSTIEELKASYRKERRKCKELENFVSRLKVCNFKANLSG